MRVSEWDSEGHKFIGKYKSKHMCTKGQSHSKSEAQNIQMQSKIHVKTYLTHPSLRMWKILYMSKQIMCIKVDWNAMEMLLQFSFACYATPITKY